MALNEGNAQQNYSGQGDRPQGILLVDDDERVLKFVSGMLHSFGYDEIYPATSPDEALKTWRTHQHKIWLLITDFVMPCLTGDLLASELMKERSNLKALFISGNDADSLSSKISLRSGRNFLQKPFTATDLRQIILNLAGPG